MEWVEGKFVLVGIKSRYVNDKNLLGRSYLGYLNMGLNQKLLMHYKPASLDVQVNHFS